MTKQTAYQKARKKAKAKVEFYIHLAVFVGVILLLTAINLTTSSEYFWVKWPLMGWGIGLFFHGLSVFVFSEDSSFTEKMIEKEMRKEEWTEDEDVGIV